MMKFGEWDAHTSAPALSPGIAARKYLFPDRTGLRRPWENKPGGFLEKSGIATFHSELLQLLGEGHGILWNGLLA
jgi:hypothetical protein